MRIVSSKMHLQFKLMRKKIPFLISSRTKFCILGNLETRNVECPFKLPQLTNTPIGYPSCATLLRSRFY